MWTGVTRFIIRYRIVLLSAVVLITVFMGYNARDLKLSYELIQVVPKDDADFQNYEEFKTLFGNDGNTLVVGLQSDEIFKLKTFLRWRQLAYDIEQIEGIDDVYSLADLRLLNKNKAEQRFDVSTPFNDKIENQQALDSLKEVLYAQPFYDKVVLNKETMTTFLAVKMNFEVLQSEKRDPTIEKVMEICSAFTSRNQTTMHFSGMPYIRYVVANMVQSELQFFSLLSLAVCAVILLLFFRSFSSVIFPVLVILIIVTWALGTIGLMDLRINVILSLVPPLIIIIGVPNFIYLVNKYHAEYKKHGNKIRAISRMVEKIGVVTLMTNLTTAIGFLVLAFTDSPVLQEFGLVAGINIIATFVVSIIIIPVVFSYLPEPSPKHTNYLNHGLINGAVEGVVKIVTQHRNKVYVATLIFVAFAGWGITKLNAVGYILDDIEPSNKVYKDLKFFEEHFGGVLPFEVLIRAENAAQFDRIEMMKKIDQFQDSLNNRPELSRSFSYVDLVKFSRQSFYNGAESRYDVPRSSRELTLFISPYITNTVQDTLTLTNNLVDSTGKVARISANMADVGSADARKLADEMAKYGKEVFGDEFELSFTGLSLIYLKNNQYLIQSLIYSLVLAFIIISILIGLLFKRLRMVLISLLPNFVPLIATAGMMGFLGIPLKPSTVLVFSIAFGICIDDALHFLAKYRQELRNHNWSIEKVLIVALRETGRSMIYTSVVLFAGFSIFMLSDFGGTKWLGLLTSTNLLIAMITNLILLPSLIKRFYKERDL